MKKAVVLLMMVACILLLTGCAKTLNAGVVTEKQFSPAYKTYNPIIFVTNRHTQIIPRWTNHPDQWFVYVQDGEDHDCWSVSKEYFESVEVGEYVQIQRR